MSPQSTLAVCVSCVPASVKVPFSAMLPPTGTGPVVAPTLTNTGGTLLIVTVVSEPTGGLMLSVVDKCAFKTASSLHVTDGVSVLVFVGVHVVPASWSAGVIVQVFVRVLFSGSLAVPVSCFVVPSVPL